MIVSHFNGRDIGRQTHRALSIREHIKVVMKS
jgi:hypothetical protein